METAPDAGATWLLTEIDPDDHDHVFGLCDLGLGMPEIGWVSLGELAAVLGRLGASRAEVGRYIFADRGDGVLPVPAWDRVAPNRAHAATAYFTSPFSDAVYFGERVGLIGPPGTGKSRFARRLGEVLGLAVTVYGCAGVADSSFIGTSRQWSTGRACVPLQAIRRAEMASVLVVLDELSRAGTRLDNGRLVDGVLALTERETARAFQDPFLECPVDLSGVSYLATANTRAGLDVALLSRFRVLEMGPRTAASLPSLTRGILADLRAERGLDAAWLPDPDPEEEAVLAGHPGIREVAIVGVPDPYYGEALLAVLVPNAGATLTASAFVTGWTGSGTLDNATVWHVKGGRIDLGGATNAMTAIGTNATVVLENGGILPQLNNSARNARAGATAELRADRSAGERAEQDQRADRAQRIAAGHE